jgi:hypothetical protein
MTNPELDKYVATRRKGNSMNMIKLEMSLEECNLVLMALAKQPFEQVAGLFGKLQQQVQPQLPKQDQPMQ